MGFLGRYIAWRWEPQNCASCQPHCVKSCNLLATHGILAAQHSSLPWAAQIFLAFQAGVYAGSYPEIQFGQNIDVSGRLWGTTPERDAFDGKFLLEGSGAQSNYGIEEEACSDGCKTEQAETTERSSDQGILRPSSRAEVPGDEAPHWNLSVSAEVCERHFPLLVGDSCSSSGMMQGVHNKRGQGCDVHVHHVVWCAFT